MKVNGRWVAWIAALALAAMLTATPREGAAGPYKMGEPPHSPLLGDPEQPSSGTTPEIELEIPWLEMRVRFVWTAGSLVAVVVPRPMIAHDRASKFVGQEQ